MSSKKIIDLRKKQPGVPSGRPAASEPPVVQAGKRISPIRVRRRKARVVMFGLIAAVLIAVLGGVSFASYLPQYSIDSISVVGAQAVPQSEISDYVESLIYNGSHHFLSRGNIFLYPKLVIEQDLVTDFPRIQSAQVSRDSLFSTALTVTVSERQPYALWCDTGSAFQTGTTSSSSCYDIDQSGFIFAEGSGASTSEPYLFTGGIATTTANPIGQMFAPGHMPGIAVFLQLLSQAGFEPQGASIENDEDFAVPLLINTSNTMTGFSVYASFGEDASQLVNNLQLVLNSDALQGQEQNLEYVDLRFGDRVYYKLKGEDQQEASSTPAQ